MFAQNRTLKLERGLYLLEQRSMTTYAARAWVNGKWAYRNLETTNYRAAEQAAVKWFRALTAKRDNVETVAETMRVYLDSIHDATKRQNHAEKWAAMRAFFSPGMSRPDVYVRDVDGPLLVRFVEWRREQTPTIKANTIRKNLVTLRQALKYAMLRGVIGSLPMFPTAHIIGKTVANPQPWLTKAEWERLRKLSQERIKAADNPRTRQQREELAVFLELMHCSCLRVDEAAHLRARDCTVKHTKAASRTEIERRARRAPKGPLIVLDVQPAYLEVVVHRSKTGPRTVLTRAVDARVVEWIRAKQPSDPIFAESHRDGFRELLIAAGLRDTEYGPRNRKCLRPTAISHWLLDRPTIPLSWLAANAGTSIQMLNDYYVKRLGLALDGSAWL